MTMWAILTVLVITSLTTVRGQLTFIHHSAAELENYLVDVNSRFPNITDLYSIGRSVRGTDLWVLAIGKDIGERRELRPEVKYVGNMHGNEVTGRELLLHLIEHYVTSYGTNATLTAYLDSTVVHIMPTMNPDGYEDSFEGNCTGIIGRRNHNNFDLNRNFPDLFHGNDQTLQVETQAVMNWIKGRNFVLSANLHGGALVANYPFDSYRNASTPPGSGPAASPDDDVFRHLSLVYSYSHRIMFNDTSCTGSRFEDGITNGAEWYPITGGMQDYNYIWAGCFELTLEVSCCKFPYASELEEFWTANKDSLVNLLMEAHRGVKGIIRDSDNRFYGGATLSIQGRESVPFTSSHYGEYWRLLMPGTYTLQVKAHGYADVTQQFTVQEGEVTRLDITLAEPTDSQTRSNSAIRAAGWSYLLLAFMAISLVFMQ